jgi:hypothetical protein
MKFLVLTSVLLSELCAAPLPVAQLKDVKSVYLYPMPGGFEQLLASRLVNDHVYQVVTDPKLADAVFTDSLSDAFLYKLDHIQTPPQPVNSSGSISSMSTNVEAPHASSFSRGKGTLFLVDAKTKQVVWSIFQEPKDHTPAALNKLAKKAADQLEIANGMKPAKN